MLIWLVVMAYVIDTYYDNKYSKQLMLYKKHFKIGMILFAAFSLYIFNKQNPTQSKSFMQHLNGAIHYMPMDKQSKDLYV